MSARKIIGGCLVTVFLLQNDPSYAYQWGELELRPWASVQEEYDSNITYAHSGVLSDFVTAPRLGFDGTYTGKNDNAELNISLEEEIYAKYSQFDNLSEYLSGTYNKDFSYYDHLKLEDGFEHAEDPTTFTLQFGRTAGRYDYYQNGFDSDWTHDVSDQLKLQYKFINNYYDPLLSGLSSSIQFKPGIEADYEFNSVFRLLSYTDFTYHDLADFGSMTKETLGVGLRNYWTPQLYLEGRTGVDFIQPIIGSDIVRPQYLVSLNDQVDQRTLYTLSYSNEYDDTPYSEFLFNNWQVSLEVKQDLNKRASVYASVFTGKGTYVQEGINEHLTGARAGVIIHVTKNVDFRAEYGFSDNGSNDSANAYQKQTALLAISIKF